MIWSPEALQGLDLVLTYLHGLNPAAAERIGRKLVAAGESLSELPERGRPISRGRRELVAAPPYLITYRTRAGAVEIITVRHAARRRY